MDTVPGDFTFGKKTDNGLVSIESELEQYRRPLIPDPSSIQKPVLKPQVEVPSDFVGPSRPQQKYDDDSSSSSDDDQEEVADHHKLPVKEQEISLEEQRVRELSKILPCSHEVLLRGHSKTVTTIDCDAKGIRLISGANDYDVRMWDFTGMNKNMNSFRIIEPSEGHVVRALSWAPNSTQFLVCTGSSQPKVYNRDGKEVLECIKGDMYISDLNHTRGHTHMVKDGQWSPTENNIFMTCSSDSTVRLWDVNSKLVGVEQQLSHKALIKCKNSKGVKIGCTTCRFSTDGKLVAVACDDGAIHIYNSRNQYSRPEQSMQGAHKEDVTSLEFFKNNTQLLSRAMDSTLKLWDVRNLKKPVEVWYNLDNNFWNTKVSLSPDEKTILTGVSAKREDDFGKVAFIDAEFPYKIKGQLSISKGSVTSVLWQPVLNQIFVGSTDGTITILYDPEKSNKGALLCISKKPREAQPDDIQYMPEIRTPHALPSFKENTTNRKRRLEKIRQDPFLSKKPEMPLQGVGKGGKIAGASTTTQFIMRTQAERKDLRDDPREALLALDEETRKNPQFIFNAYKSTQPGAIFDYTTPEHEEQELLSRYNKICPSCGLKICKCGNSKS